MEEYNGCSVPQYTAYPHARIRLQGFILDRFSFATILRYSPNLFGFATRC